MIELPKELKILNFNEVEAPKAEEITLAPTDNLKKLDEICKIMSVLCLTSRGVGLNAVQIGINHKIHVVRANNYSLFGPQGKFGFFINCEYEGVGEKAKSKEGCLSLRKLNNKLDNYIVDRYRIIIVKGYQLSHAKDGPYLKEINRELHNINQSVVFQHEIDHHNGILIRDIGERV